MMKISGKTRLAGLYGLPTGHSISPAMHTAAFAARDFDAVYLSFDIAPEELAASIQAIRTFQMVGVNVTMPYKREVIPYLDELSPAACLSGAVNTIVNCDQRLIGHNTDGIGFMRSLADEGIDPIGKEMTVLGTGGAATAIIVQAALDGVKKIHVFNRQKPSFAAVGAKLREIGQQTHCQIELFDLADEVKLAYCLGNSCLVVNATSLGMQPEDPLPLSAELLTENLAVMDLIYKPRQTKLLALAEAKGLKWGNGLGMLLYQGAAAFTLWTGKEMPLDVVRPLVV